MLNRWRDKSPACERSQNSIICFPTHFCFLDDTRITAFPSPALNETQRTEGAIVWTALALWDVSLYRFLQSVKRSWNSNQNNSWWRPNFTIIKLFIHFFKVAFSWLLYLCVCVFRCMYYFFYFVCCILTCFLCKVPWEATLKGAI